MTDHEASNERTPSTRWEWRRCMVSEPPKAPRQRGAEGSSSPPLSSRELREPLTLTVSYRGGPEAWWQIKARGRTWRRPGSLCLHDVLQEIYAGQRHARE